MRFFPVPLLVLVVGCGLNNVLFWFCCHRGVYYYYYYCTGIYIVPIQSSKLVSHNFLKFLNLRQMIILNVIDWATEDGDLYIIYKSITMKSKVYIFWIPEQLFLVFFKYCWYLFCFFNLLFYLHWMHLLTQIWLIAFLKSLLNQWYVWFWKREQLFLLFIEYFQYFICCSFSTPLLLLLDAFIDTNMIDCNLKNLLEKEY